MSALPPITDVVRHIQVSIWLSVFEYTPYLIGFLCHYASGLIALVAMRLLCAFVLASSLWVRPLALGADEAGVDYPLRRRRSLRAK